MSPARWTLPADSVAAELATIAALADVAASGLFIAQGRAVERNADETRREIGSAAWRLADAAKLLAQLAGALEIEGPGLTEPTGRGAVLAGRPEAGR